MRTLAILLACASIAACGSEPTQAPENQSVEANGQGAPAAEPDNAAAPAAEIENEAGAPEPAPIPAAFRGIWAETEALCDNLSDPSRLVISGRTLRFPTFVVEVARVDTIGPREINIISTAAGEGTDKPAEHHVSIDAAGETLTDQGGGGMVRRRCGG